MNHDPPSPLLETILSQCALAARQPWYPSDFVQATGTPRAALDPDLERLRQGGLIQLTEWVAGKGQGYRLTPAGEELVRTPRLMEAIRQGRVPKFREKKPEPLVRRAPSGQEARLAALQASLDDDRIPAVTVALILANIAVFLTGFVLGLQEGVSPSEFVKGSPERVLDLTGALSAAHIVVRHEWWRLLTCCFVHLGLIHLAVNMYSLYVVGPMLEKLWGSGRFLLLYLISGVCGSCAMIWNTPFALGAGASGALWGIIASMGTWIYLNRRVLHPDLIAEWRQQLLVTLALNLGITFGIPNISKGAHLGGGLAGMLTGFPLDWLQFGGPWLRRLGVGLLALLPLGSIAGLALFLDRNQSTIVQRWGERELYHFNREGLPHLQHVVRDAEAVRDQFRELARQQPSQRDAEKVATVLRHLADAQAEIRHVSGEFKYEPPSASPRIRKLQDVTQQYLGAWVELLDAAQYYLHKGSDATNEDLLAVARRFQQEKALGETWKQAYDEANAAPDNPAP